MAATLALYFGADKINLSGEQPAKEKSTGINAAWATLVFNGSTIDWIGDPKIMQAARAKGLSISFINASDEALKTLHLKPILDGVGVPALVLQEKDGRISHIKQVKTLDEAVKQFDLINP